MRKIRISEENQIETIWKVMICESQESQIQEVQYLRKISKTKSFKSPLPDMLAVKLQNSIVKEKFLKITREKEYFKRSDISKVLEGRGI